jgi:hypothetical protein
MACQSRISVTASVGADVKKVNKNKMLQNAGRRSFMSSVPVELAEWRRIIGGGSRHAGLRDNALISC